MLTQTVLMGSKKELDSPEITNFKCAKMKIASCNIFYCLFKIFIDTFTYLNHDLSKIQFVSFLISLAALILITITGYKQKISSRNMKIFGVISWFLMTAIDNTSLIYTFRAYELDSLILIRLLYCFIILNFIRHFFLLEDFQLLRAFSFLNSIIIVITVIIYNPIILNSYFELILNILVGILLELYYIRIIDQKSLEKEIIDDFEPRKYEEGLPFLILKVRDGNKFFPNSNFKKHFLSKDIKSIDQTQIILNSQTKQQSQFSILNNSNINESSEFNTDDENFAIQLKKIRLTQLKKKKNDLNHTQEEDSVCEKEVSLTDLIKSVQKSKEIFDDNYISFGIFKQVNNRKNEQDTQINKNEKDYQNFEIFYRRIIHSKYKNEIEILIHNITPLSEFEKMKAEKKYKHKILSKVAHEFKTPLISIISSVNNISIRQENSEILLNNISYLSYYMIFLVNDIVEYANDSIIDLLIEEIDPSKIVEFSFEILKMMKIYQNKTKIKIYLDLDEEVKNMKISTDFNRILQILINLISNSIKFTKNGEIRIIAKKISEDKILVEVKDSGSGISQDKIEHLKIEKYNLNISFSDEILIGTGLGLKICQKICNELKTDLKIKSKFGEGTQISFEIKNFRGENTRKNSIDQYKSKKVSSIILEENGELPPNYFDINNGVINQESRIFTETDPNYLNENRDNRNKFQNFSTIRINAEALETNNKFRKDFNFEATTLVKADCIFIDESLRRDLNRKFTFSDNSNVTIKGVNPHYNSGKNLSRRNLNIVSSRLEGKISNLAKENINLSMEHKKSLEIPEDNSIDNKRSLGQIFSDISNHLNVNNSINIEKYYILIIDDMIMCRNLLEKQIKDCLPTEFADKIKIIHCCDGVEFLYLVIKNLPIIYCFIDENMEFMNGSETVGIIKKMGIDKKPSCEI